MFFERFHVVIRKKYAQVNYVKKMLIKITLICVT